MARLTDEQLTTNLHISGRTKDGWGSWLPNGEIESMARELLAARRVVEAAKQFEVLDGRSIGDKFDDLHKALTALDAEGESK
mgnify:CR=1 FL=1